MTAPVAHETVTVIVDGALEADETFTDYARRNEYIRQVAEDADADGYPTDVYILRHYHALDDACECAQFATDHRPAYSFPEDTPPAINTR